MCNQKPNRSQNYWYYKSKPLLNNNRIMGILSQPKNNTCCMMETNSSIHLKVKLTPTPVGAAIVEERRDLDVAFSPGEFDVVCGKGR